MSQATQNASLRDYLHTETETVDVDTEALREQALEGGARYRSPITTTREDAGEDLATSQHDCQNCGSTVTRNYHRCNSDNQGILWHCINCPTVNQSDMKNGAGAKPDFEARISNHQSRTGGL